MTKYKRLSISIYDKLFNEYGSFSTFLTYHTEFQLLIAVILSAQCTDERVNLTTPSLFKRFPTIKDLAFAKIDEIQFYIKNINFYKNKSIFLKKTALIIHEKYNDNVPKNEKELVKLPGVGLKTANVILGQLFNQDAITVDTHVNRLSKRIGFSTETNAIKKEKILKRRWEKKYWTDLSTLLIVHGRKVCTARNPKCENCCIYEYCSKIDI